MILPRLVTFTCEPGCIIAVCINQGSPRQTRISKTLLPTALLTAMSPSPSLITANDERASGTLTPAATNVRPIIVSGIPRVLPMEYRISAMKRKKTKFKKPFKLYSFNIRQKIRLTYDRDHPHHDVTIETNPNHRYAEGEGIPIAKFFLAAIWHRCTAHEMNRVNKAPREKRPFAAICRLLQRRYFVWIWFLRFVIFWLFRRCCLVRFRCGWSSCCRCRQDDQVYNKVIESLPLLIIFYGVFNFQQHFAFNRVQIKEIF